MSRGLAPLLCILFTCGIAQAQVEEIDPDAPAVKKKARAVDDDEDTSSASDEEVKPVSKKPSPSPKVEKKAEPKKVEPPPRPAPPALVVAKVSDADLDAAWEKWRIANSAQDAKTEPQARAQLLKLKSDLGSTQFETYAIGLLRAALHHERAGDSAGAVERGLAALELAPDLPAVHLGLARTYFAGDVGEVGRYAREAQRALVLSLRDIRYLRASVADLSVVLMVSWVALAAAIAVVLFVKRARYFFFDFHFLFPRVLARWQSTVLGSLVLALPLLFRMGLAPVLLALFAAVALYLRHAERAIAAVLLAGVGLVPVLAGSMMSATAFPGTKAEAAFTLERAGPGAEAVAQTLSKAADEDTLEFSELFALGSFEVRRGKLEAGIKHLKAALLKRPNDPSACVNLANALMAQGDLENARDLYETAVSKDPAMAAAHWGLYRLHQRRVELLGDGAALEVDQASAELATARGLDPSLATRADPPDERRLVSAYLVFVPMPRADLWALARPTEGEEALRAQVSTLLLGDVKEPLTHIYPALAALLIFALGFLAPVVEAAKVCSKCGRPVSRREDKELGKGSQMCAQCVNVYARREVVPTTLRVRKQLEVARHSSRTEKVGYFFGLMCSGMGHVFSGFPVQGAIYGFLFFFTVAGFFLRHGVFRPPFEALPVWLKLLPLAVIFVTVYLLSLRGLFKTQSEER